VCAATLSRVWPFISPANLAGLAWESTIRSFAASLSFGSNSLETATISLGRKFFKGAWGFGLEAERKLGGMLIKMWPERAKGGRPRKTNRPSRFVFDAVQLKEIGINNDESSKAQFLTRFSEETFQAIKSFMMTLAQVLDSESYSYQTFRISGWVAGRIEVFRRLNSLSWSHHQAVAALEPKEQDRFLDLAVGEQQRDGLLDQSQPLRAAVQLVLFTNCFPLSPRVIFPQSFQ